MLAALAFALLIVQNVFIARNIQETYYYGKKQGYLDGWKNGSIEGYDRGYRSGYEKGYDKCESIYEKQPYSYEPTIIGETQGELD